MKRILILLFMMVILLSACQRQKAVIFFSSYPINQRFLLDAQNSYNSLKIKHKKLKEKELMSWYRKIFSIPNAEVNFKTGQKIHFVLFNPDPFTSDVLRLQILKVDIKPPLYAFNVEQGRDIEIDTTKNYAESSFTLHRKGYYLLRIFSRDSLNNPVAEADFKVDPL